LQAPPDFSLETDQVALRLAENTFRRAFSELERAPARHQHANIGEATIITSARPNEQVVSFVFIFTPLSLLLEL
jgi:hypothetical protein